MNRDKLEHKNCLLVVGTYNNGDRLLKTVQSAPSDFPIDILIVDDGSTDDSLDMIKDLDLTILRHETNQGIGVLIRTGCKYAREKGYAAVAFIPGNNKNTIAEVPRLLEPIISDRADYVQGSRFLPGSRRDHTPLFRLIMVKLIALFLTTITFRKITDSMEGFRAIRLSILDDQDIDIDQLWLDRYALEIYLFFKVTKGRRFRYKEVPISKVYPPIKKSIVNRKGAEYTKIKPFLDWWDILKPIFYLWLRIRK